MKYTKHNHTHTYFKNEGGSMECYSCGLLQSTIESSPKKDPYRNLLMEDLPLKEESCTCCKHGKENPKYHCIHCPLSSQPKPSKEDCHCQKDCTEPCLKNWEHNAACLKSRLEPSKSKESHGTEIWVPWEEEFDLFWGLAPKSSLKYKKGKEVKQFIAQALLKQREDIAKRNYSPELGTYDYDGIAEEVLKGLKKGSDE